MRDRGLILSALPAGLALGALAWLALGRGGGQVQALETAAGQLQVLSPPKARRTAAAAGLVGPAGPLFGRLDGEAATPEPVLALQGLARTVRRQGALISINGAAADWLAVGETRDGVTLQEVNARGVTVTTASGLKTLGLGAPSSAAMPAPALSPEPGPPPGMRSPPAPASATQ